MAVGVFLQNWINWEFGRACGLARLQAKKVLQASLPPRDASGLRSIAPPARRTVVWRPRAMLSVPHRMYCCGVVAGLCLSVSCPPPLPRDCRPAPGSDRVLLPGAVVDLCSSPDILLRGSATKCWWWPGAVFLCVGDAQAVRLANLGTARRTQVLESVAMVALAAARSRWRATRTEKEKK
jgi:hypothetical protein